jgi:hypothetical protein
MAAVTSARSLKRRSAVIVFTAIAASAATGWIVYGADAISGRVTSYSATCLQRAPDNRCAAMGRTLEPSVFRVSTALQRVESIGEHGKVVQLRSCEVTSKRDWHCVSASVDGFELGFSEGRPWLRIRGSSATDLVFLPRWTYLWLKSGEPHHGLGPALFR